MPIISSTYSSLISNGHWQTILPNLLRKVKFIEPETIEISTPDSDFLEFDYYKNENSNKIAIISHGLEGNSRRAYVRGMARHLYNNGYSVVAWNFRTCGSKINLQKRLYHSGETEDIDMILNFVSKMDGVESIYLIGFSMGGNITVKYLGEQSINVNPKVKTAVVFSVPLDLVGSSLELGKKENQIYMKRFLRKLKKKVLVKSIQFPSDFNSENYDNIKNFEEFDNRYTAPTHGFSSARDYWEKASSLPYIEKIQVPTLIVNAQNDSFLSKDCFPFEIAKKSKFIHFEAPKTGGHVGFFSLKKVYWSEKRALEFCDEF